MRHPIWQAALAVLLITTLGQAKDKVFYVNVPTVNIRTNAGTQYKVHKVVARGYPLKVLAEEGSWYKVKLKDESVGWIHQNTVTEDMPDVAKIAKLEAKLATQATELGKTGKQLKLNLELNSQLKQQLEEIQQDIDKLTRQNRELKGRERIKLAAMGIGVLLLGWGFGFATGFFKRQAEDKRFIKMMVEANSLKK